VNGRHTRMCPYYGHHAWRGCDAQLIIEQASTRKPPRFQVLGQAISNSGAARV